MNNLQLSEIDSKILSDLFVDSLNKVFIFQLMIVLMIVLLIVLIIILTKQSLKKSNFVNKDSKKNLLNSLAKINSDSLPSIHPVGVWNISQYFKHIGNMKGYSLAANETGFLLPDIGFALDAGIQGKCLEHILISHLHADHIKALAQMVLFRNISSKIPTVYVPFDTCDKVMEYILSFLHMSVAEGALKGVNVVKVKPGDKINVMSNGEEFQIEVIKSYHNMGENSVGYAVRKYSKKLKDEYKKLLNNNPDEYEQKIKVQKKICKELNECVKKYTLPKDIMRLKKDIGIANSDIMNLENELKENNNSKYIKLEMSKIQNHLSVLNKKLKGTEKKFKKYLSKKDVDSPYSKLTQQELVTLIEEKDIVEKKLHGLFIYTGDTTNDFFNHNINWNDFPYIITECTYINDLSNNNVENNGKQNGHMTIKNLLVTIKKYPKVKFILFHWSKRYKMKDIDEYFEKLNIENIFPWTNGYMLRKRLLASFKSNVNRLLDSKY